MQAELEIKSAQSEWCQDDIVQLQEKACWDPEVCTCPCVTPAALPACDCYLLLVPRPCFAADSALHACLWASMPLPSAKGGACSCSPQLTDTVIGMDMLGTSKPWAVLSSSSSSGASFHRNSPAVMLHLYDSIVYG